MTQIQKSLNSEIKTLRILSYNIQAGITTKKYREYITGSWKYLLPYDKRMKNLEKLAGFVGEYDMVGLQEVDGGSLRSDFINQTEYIASKACFPHWYDQINRNIGRIAKNSIGFLSRYPITKIITHKLPGMIPGRGALTVRFGANHAFTIIIVHLSLGARSRKRQLKYLANEIKKYTYVLVVGDFNAVRESEEMSEFVEETGMGEPLKELNTFPSWNPKKHIDHIFISSNIKVKNVEVIDYKLSDHLPIVAEIELPQDIKLSAS